MKTINELYKEALEIQNACNVCGLAQRFAAVLKELMHITDGKIDQVNRHAIVTLWLDKFNSLNGIQFNEEPIHEAYRQAFDLVPSEER